MRAHARRAAAGACACAAAFFIIAGAATPRLCTRPIDVGSALRELVGDATESARPLVDPTDTAARGRAFALLMAVGAEDGLGPLPDRLAAVAERLRRLSRAHAIRYPVHAGLGTYLEALRCDPSAAAVQWVKAAHHARTVAEAVRAGDGLGRAVARDPAGVAREICAGARRAGHALVRHALNRSGIVCPIGPGGM